MNNSTDTSPSDHAQCPHAVSVFFTTSMAIITSGSLIGNFLVFVTVYKNPNLRTSTNYYYVNVAVSDFLASLAAWPLYLTDEIITSKGSLVQGPLATAGCKVGMFVRAVSTTVSILSLVLVAVDRFIATVYPLKAVLLSGKKRVALMFATWLIAIGYCGPMLYFSKVEDFGAEIFCRLAWNDAFAIIVYYVVGIILAIVPFTAIITFYPRIMTVLRQRPIPEFGSGSINLEHKRRKQSQNVMKIFRSLVIAYSVGFGVLCIYLILKMASPDVFVKDKCKWILGFTYFLVPSLSTGVNPFILFSFSSNFRLALKTLFLSPLENNGSCCKWSRNVSVLPRTESYKLNSACDREIGCSNQQRSRVGEPMLASITHKDHLNE